MMMILLSIIIKYIPLQQGLRHGLLFRCIRTTTIIKYIPLQQGLRLCGTVNEMSKTAT